MGPAPKDAGPNAFEPRKRALAGKNEFKVRLEKRKKRKERKRESCTGVSINCFDNRITFIKTESIL